MSRVSLTHIGGPTVLIEPGAGGLLTRRRPRFAVGNQGDSRYGCRRDRACDEGVVDAPIVGATKEHHLDDAVAAVDLELTEDEIELTAPYTPHEVAGFQ